MPEQDINESEMLQYLAQLRSQVAARDPQLFPVLQWLAKRYFEQHRYVEVRPLLDECLEIRIAALGEGHYHVADSIAQLASLETEQQRPTAAIVLLQRAQRIVEAYGDERRTQLAVLLNQLGEALYADARYSEAMDHCKRALELLGGKIHTTTPEMMRTRNNLAALHVARGEYYLAARLLKLNVQIMKSDGSANDLAVSTTLNNLAEVFRLQGQHKEAWGQAVRALWTRRRAVGRKHPLVAQSWANLATIRFDDGRYKAAESLFKRAIAIRESRSHTHPALHAEMLRRLAEVVLAAGRSYEAETIYRQAAEIYEKAFGANDPQLALTLTSLGRLHIECGQHGSAQQVLSRAVEIQESRRNARDAAIALTYSTYGNLHAARNNFEQAEVFYRRALDMQRNVLGSDHPDVAATLVLLGDATFARGDHPTAEKAFRKALDIRRKQLGEGHKSVAEGMHRLARLMVADHEPERAIELCSAIRKKHVRTLGLVPQLHADVLGTLADANLSLDRLDDVESLSREELALREPHQQARPGESVPALSRLTKLYLRLRQFGEAVEMSQLLVTLAEKLHGANHPNMIPTVEQFAAAQIARGDDEADETVRRAIKLRERKFGADSDELTSALERFANLFHEAGRLELADEYFTRASNIRDRHTHALFV
ncbi:MAG: tetratricopeptide repeat protein [Planctomycetaceae bacterium]